MKNQKYKDQQKQVKMYTFLLQFSINMIVPIFACTFLGYFLDQKLGIVLFVFVGFIIGALSGFTSIYRLTKEMTKKDEISVDYPVVNAKKGDIKKDD